MNKKILVTGGSGMVGKHLQEIIPDAIYISSNQGDLRDIKYTTWLFSCYEPDVVVHLAAKVGGIQDNIKYPADYFDDNVLINTNVLKSCHKYNTKQFIGVISTCAYPDVVPNYPMIEKDLFSGPPAKTNFSYGFAKRSLAVQVEAYNKQYGTNYSYLIPSNLYSEYDNFTNELKMHFITALLHKIKNSKGTIELLGDGTPLRQFMYAGDFAGVIKEAIDKNITESFNVACPENYSIDKMARICLEELGLDYKIKYINPTLNGQYRKDVSSKKMMSLLPDFEFTPFNEGIKKVYDKISK
jgi:GDP-L-fucose synthase